MNFAFHPEAEHEFYEAIAFYEEAQRFARFRLRFGGLPIDFFDLQLSQGLAGCLR